MTRKERMEMIDSKGRQISVRRQCDLLDVNRSTAYYRPQPVKAEDLKLMELIDKQYLQTPTFGSRSMRDHLQRKGHAINRKRVQRLMQTMGLEAIYPKPNTSRPHPKHKIYPYLLKGMNIDRPDKVWAADITYVPMKRSYMYLVVIMDWYSRKVLSWRLSNTLDTSFCVAALEEAIIRYGCPDIFNTGQGSQFTARKFLEVLESNNVRISMDGRGRAFDNIFVERLWWTVKYHYIYLREFETGNELKQGLGNWFAFYNQERSHQSLKRKTPDEVYFKEQIKLKAD